MKRPLLAVFCALVLGIVFGRLMAGEMILFAACLAAGAAFLIIRYRKPQYLFFVLFGLLGFFLVSLSVSPKNAALERVALNNGEVTVRAVVLSTKKTSGGNVSAVVKALSVVGGDGVKYRAGINLYLIDTGGGVKPGDKISVTSELARLDGVRNPGGFDQFQYLRSRKVEYRLFAADVTKSGTAFRPEVFFAGIREEAGRRFEKVFEPGQAGIMKALIIGDKSDLDKSDAELFRDMGVYHILAVSGLHITIIAAAVNALFAFFLKRRQAALATMGLLFFYCLFTGAGIASVRAFIMFSAQSAAPLINRDKDPLSGTAFAGIMLLIYEPLYLWDSGFQYSFTAVAALILLAKPVQKIFDIIGEKYKPARKFFGLRLIKASLAPTVAATLATYPITMYHCGTLPLYAVISNILIVPSVFILVLCGFIICLFGGLGMAVSGMFALVCSFILNIYELIGLIITALPFSKLTTGRPEVIFIVLFYALAALFVCLMNVKGKPSKKKAGLFLAACVLFVLSGAVAGLKPEGLRITVLDVGQGDCSVIEYKGEVMVIDGGGNSFASGPNTGANVLVPYLRYRGVNRVDSVFVSHPDADHAIGIIELLELMPVDRLYIAWGTEREGVYYDGLIKAAEKNGCAVSFMKSGDTAGGAVTVSCLYPFEHTKASDSNDQSLVLKLSSGGLDLLFTGDISSAVERELLKYAYSELDCDVLKLAHHGSRYSSCAEFLEAVSPLMAVAGAGRNNSYGHPSEDVRARLAVCGADLFDTAAGGAVIITFNGAVLKVKTMVE